MWSNMASKLDQIIEKFDFPEEVESIKVESKKLVDVMVEAGLVDSTSQAKRDIKQGGVKVNEKVVDDINAELELGESLIQKGKRHFIKVVIS